MIIAAIDIGSNTALLLIAEITGGENKIIPVREEQMIPRISDGLSKNGEINQHSIDRLLYVLNEYFSLIKNYNCEKVIVTGTNAFRIASNSEAIKSIIKKEFKAELNILSGEEEAEMAYIGTPDYGHNGNNRLVIDIGGGSTEIIYGDKKNMLFKKSFNVGVVSICEKFMSPGKSRDLIMNFLESNMNKDQIVLPNRDLAPLTAAALAGTPVTLASIHEGLKIYKENEVEGYVLEIETVRELSGFLESYSPDQLLEMYPDLLKGRQDLILIGAYILLYIMDILNLDSVIVSTKGIRYGAIIKYLDTIS